MATGEVAAGVVGKPLGLRGEVYVHPDADVGDPFAPGTSYRAGNVTLTVASSRLHGARRVVRFEGIEDREAAEALRGTVLALDRADVPLDEDAFWAQELLGRDVVTPAGQAVGVLVDVADGAAHDYLVVATPQGQQVLVPAVSELVDITPERIIVQDLPGLLTPEE